MKEKKLLKALSNVDERYLEEMNESKATGKRPMKKLVWVAAAALALTAVLMGSAMIRIWPAIDELGKLPLADPAQVEPQNIKLSVSEVTAASMKVHCQIQGMEDEQESIYIHPNGPFTLERKTETGWEPLEAKFQDPQWRADEMLTAGYTDWYVNWSGVYGVLEQGTYRYSAVVVEGKEPTAVEFAVSDQLNNDLRELVNNILNSPSYVIRCTNTAETSSLEHLSKKDREAVASFTTGGTSEFWKHDDQLLVFYYYDIRPEQPASGMMYKNGSKYQLDHEGNNNANPVIGWSLWPELDRNRLTRWVEEMVAESNEYEYRYAPDGTLESLVQVIQRYNETYGITITWTENWEWDTEDPGAAAMLAKQDVTTPRSFSWEEDCSTKELQPLPATNAEAQSVTTVDQAVELATAQCTIPYSKVIVYHDDSADMWKVEFQNVHGKQGYQFIYLTDNGLLHSMATGAPRA